jgi:hypothetical protein
VVYHGRDYPSRVELPVMPPEHVQTVQTRHNLAQSH